MKVIIPMSGVGQRFLDAGYTDPKPLISVDGKPMIHHVMDMFPGAEFLCIYNSEHTNVPDVIGNRAKCVAIPAHKKGPVWTVLAAEEHISDEDEVIVSYCDYGTQWNFEKFCHEMKTLGADGGIAAYTGFHPHMLGPDHYAYVRHDNMWMLDIQEKSPFTDNKMNEYASNGTYYVRTGRMLKEYCRRLMSSEFVIKGEFYISMIFKLMVNDSLKVRIFEIDKMLQWGTPRDLEEYNTWSGLFKYKQKDVGEIDAVTVLPMAGYGSRFSREGFLTPKPFLEVDGKPMVQRALDCLPRTNETILIKLDSHTLPYIDASVISIPSVTDGQATTCMVACSSIPPEKPILISACDNGVYFDPDAFRDLMDNDVVVWAFDNHPTGKQKPHMYAWLDVDENNFIKRVSIKKPFEGCKYAIIGTMFFRRNEIFIEGYNEIRRRGLMTNGEYYVDNVIEPLIEKGYKVKMFKVDYYLCWGTPDDYRAYNYWKEYFESSR